MTRPARIPLVTHILVPFTIHSSPSGTARQRMFCVSLPASGSDRENAARSEPSTMRGRNRRRCSSVPNRLIMATASLCELRIPASDIQPRDNSSTMRA